MKTEDQQARVSVDGKEVWTGPWWKAWKASLNAIADNQGAKVKIEVELLG